MAAVDRDSADFDDVTGLQVKTHLGRDAGTPVTDIGRDGFGHANFYGCIVV